MRQLEQALRLLPMDRPSAKFTDGVMKRLHIVEPISLGWTLLKNLAPIFALSAIIVVMFLAMRSSGALVITQHGELVRSAQEWNTEIGRQLSVGIGFYRAWVDKYLSFVGNSVGLAVAVALFFGAVALLDKFVIMPLMRRRMDASH